MMLMAKAHCRLVAFIPAVSRVAPRFIRQRRDIFLFSGNRENIKMEPLNTNALIEWHEEAQPLGTRVGERHKGLKCFTEAI